MVTKENEPPGDKHLEWEELKPKKKDWRVWGKNLMKRRTTKQLIEDALLMHFNDQRTIQEKFKHEFFARKMKELLILRTQRRDIMSEKFHASMHAMKLKEQYGIAMQRALRVSWHNILGLQFFPDQKNEKMHKRMERVIDTHFDEAETNIFSKDIEEFESKTGFILGRDEPILQESGGKKTLAKPPPPPKKLSKTTIKPIEESIFNPLDPKLQIEQAKIAKAFILEIKEKKLKEYSKILEALKKQREDMLEEEEKNHLIYEEESKKMSEEDAASVVMHEKEEAQKQQILEERKKKIHDAWLLQQQEMQKKSTANFHLIQAHQHECYMMYFNDKVDEINKEYNSWQVDIQAKLKRRWQKHYNFCFDIILQFVSMAECINEYRLEVGKSLPINEWRQWKNLFIEGALLPVVLPCSRLPTECPSEKELRIAKEESEAYLNETKEYASPKGEEPIGKNKELGKFLVDIDGLAQSLTKSFQQPDLSKYTLMISIVGVSNAGKTILAKTLATAYRILVIDLKQVQDLAINAGIIEEEKLKVELATQLPNDDSNTSPKSSKETLTNMLSTKSLLGLQAKNAIENKIQVPDDIIANLVFLTMLHPEEYISKSEINTLSTKGALPLPKKKSTKDSQSTLKGAMPVTTLAQQNGFILDGFPQTKGQAMALEKCLTGFDFETQQAKKDANSKIAPPQELDSKQREESGLHMYFMIEAPLHDELLNQCLASTIDPTTNIVYHPLTNPIPLGDKTGIIERLQPLKSKQELLTQIATGLDIFNSMKDFLNKFSNVHFVPQHHDESGTMSPNAEIAMEIVTNFIDNKAKGELENFISDNKKSAIEVSIQAQKAVDIANNEAKNLAEIFFKVKLVEAEKMESWSADASLVDPKSNKRAPLAKGAQIGKVSDAIAKMLDEVTKIVLEVHNSATIATHASEEAQKHIQEFLNSKRELEETTLCKEGVEKALAVARQASTKATTTSNKCSTILEAAKVLARVEAPLIPPLPLPAIEPPLDLIIEVVKPPLELELIEMVEVAELVKKIWEELENKYLTTIQEGFRLLIHEQEQTIPFLIEAKKNFVQLLKEDNGKQKLCEDFQERWNRIEPEYRHEKRMIKRMYEEGIKFGEILRILASKRLQNGKEVEQQSLEDLLDERTSSFTSIFTVLVQAEFDRHIESCGLLHEYHIKKVGSKFSKQFWCNLSTAKRKPTWTFVAPKWLIPLEGSYPQFYMVLSEALAKASNLINEIAGRNIEDKKLQPQKKKPRQVSSHRNTWMKEIPPTFREVVHLDPDVKPTIAREQQIFCYRLELLGILACKYLANLQPICDGTWGQMDNWLMKRCNDELSLVEEVRSVILEACQESIPLWYNVRMESEFKVEEEEITMIVPVPPEPIIDLTPWHIKVMESIVNTFKTFSNVFEIIQEITKATLNAIDSVQMMWRIDPQNNIYPRLPRYKSRRYGHFQHWANLTNDIIEQSNGGSDTQFVSVIEWRGFLISLVDAHFDYIISAATIEDILRARMDFCMVVTTKRQGDPSEGCITLYEFLNIQLWFDKKNEDKHENLANNVDSDSDNLINETYDLAKSLKIYVFSILERRSQRCKHEESGLPWQTLLLYLCRDACVEIALCKAFTVLANTVSPDEAQLNPKELIQVLYPSGVDEAIEDGCMTWTIADMEDVVFKASIEKSTPFVELKNRNSKVQYEKDTIEQFFESRSSSHESQISEIETTTIEEFLSNVLLTISSSEKSLTPSQELEEELHYDVPILERLTVEDCIKLNATAQLCSALAATFRQHSVHIMQRAPTKM